MTSLSHKGFKAWVASEVDGTRQKLPVYDIQTQGTTISCWIASSPDTSFSVAWRKVDPHAVASSGHVFIDGKDVASGVMRPLRKRHVERSAAKISNSRARAFYFTILDLTDDELIAPIHDNRLTEAGTIKLEVSWVKIGTESSLVAAEVENITIAHEKAKKAGAMITTFADPERIERGKAVSTIPLDPENPGPHVTFIFRYHQKAMLQARGIIPNEGGQRSRVNLAHEDNEIHVGPSEGVINLESDEEEEEEEAPADILIKRYEETPALDFREASSDQLFDMGETNSLFNDDDGNPARRFGSKDSRVQDEDAMSTASDVGVHKESDVEADLSGGGLDHVEEMEEED